MPHLTSLLLALANITVLISELSRQDVAASIARNIKRATRMVTAQNHASYFDFVDVADHIDECIGHDPDLTEQDVQRLRIIARKLRNAHDSRERVQDSLLSATC